MSFLEKIIEKKDIKIYCDLRIRRHKEDLNHLDKYPEEKREFIRERILGRIRELERLGGKINDTSEIKKECKNLWKHFDLKKRREKIMDEKEREIRLKLLREISDELWQTEHAEMCIKFPDVFDVLIRRHDATEILRKKIIELTSPADEFRRVMKND